jgi:hypothetical protein
VVVEAEGRRFKSHGPLVFLKIFLFRNAPAGNHQLVAEDLMEDGTISSIINAYFTQARKKTTTNTGSLRIAICNCNVKKEIKQPHWIGKPKKNFRAGSLILVNGTYEMSEP